MAFSFCRSNGSSTTGTHVFVYCACVTYSYFFFIQPLAFANENEDKGNKRMSVERIYQRKTQLEHILLRPDTYIGSIEESTQAMWVYDGDKKAIVNKQITYVPGLYKIFDEILGITIVSIVQVHSWLVRIPYISGLRFEKLIFNSFNFSEFLLLT